MSAYRTTLASGALFVAVLGLGWWLLREPPAAPEAQPALVRFEKDDLIGFRIERPDVTIEARIGDGGEWELVGRDWRPRRSMIRRVAHQLHDLDARAVVASNPSSYEPYGLGDDAIHVTLSLSDGRVVRFDAGDPNPTSVSHYVRPLPGNTVYVVKKAAVDYYGWSLDAFREDRFAWLRAEDAVRIDATVDGRRLVLERSSPKAWRMLVPVEQDVEREQARTLLGRTASLRAQEIVDVTPEERAAKGLVEPSHRVKVELADGREVGVWVGESRPGVDPPEAWMSRGPDGAVYAARSGFLDAFRLPVEDYRRVTLLPELSASMLAKVVVQHPENPVTIERSPDGWRWSDGTPAAGRTASRLAELACGARATAFVDEGALDPALTEPTAVLSLVDRDGEEVSLVLGAPATHSDGRRESYLQVEGEPGWVRVDGALAETVAELLTQARQHAASVVERAPESPPK